MTKILIAHRGNIGGPQPSKENNPDYIQKALDAGYHVEVDVWYTKNLWFFGHDKPQWQVNTSFLEVARERLWLHCKNLRALNFLADCGLRYHYFWHQNDHYTLTSRNYIWTFPGRELMERSIAVKPEAWMGERKLDCEHWHWGECDLDNAAGICSDYIERYK